MQIIQSIQNRIYEIRGERVMLDFDLAALYEVETRVLNQAVKRKNSRFPNDFMFQLTADEWEDLQLQIPVETPSSQFVMMRKPLQNRTGKYLPYAFTEQGVAMLSSVLNSETAIRVNIQIIRVFTKMRELLSTHKDILLQLEKMKKKLAGHDEDIALIFKYLKQLLAPPPAPRNKIGFKRKDEKE